MELDMVALHKEIYEYLRTANFRDETFMFTLRKSDRYQRLSKGYWFHGNDDYLALSFWSGTAWKNRTPNINFIIYKTGVTELQIDVRDSLRKKEFVIKHLYSKTKLPISEEKLGKFYLKYDGNSYLESLKLFIIKEKQYIDGKVKENASFFYGKYSENKLGFLNPIVFQNYLEKTLLRIQNKKLNQIAGQPCRIKNMAINDFGAIDKRGIAINNLPIDASIIFLTGENGCGKTSILRAISLGLVPYSEEHDVFISKAKVSPRIKLDLYKGDSIITNLTSKDFITKERKLLCEGFAAYGPSRLVTTTKINNALKGKVSDTYSIFHPDGQLLDIESEVLRWQKLKNTININDRLEIIKEILISSIKNLGNIEWGKVDKNKNKIPTKYFEADDDGNVYDNNGVTFDQLSSGIRSLIAMIGDMLLRLFRVQKNQTDARSLVGIVIIDEIDVHLHPKLQKEIVEILSDNFQNIQFIITTHSPIPLLGAPKNSVFIKVKRDHNLGVIVERLEYLEKIFHKMLPNTIYTSELFSFEEIIQNEFSFNERLGTEDNYDEFIFNRVLEKKVEKLKEKYK